MGTRSLTIVREDGAEVATIYRQYDGYPTGQGRTLADFLRGRVIVNGLSGDRRKVSNGAGCFAAGLIGAMKGRDAGNVYLYPEGSRDVGEEYTYTLDFRRPETGHGGETLAVRVDASGWGDLGASGDPDKGKAPETLYAGDAPGFVRWIARKVKAETDASRRRAKAEGYALRKPAVSAADALADVVEVVRILRGGDDSADRINAAVGNVLAIVQRFAGPDVTAAHVSATREGAEDSHRLARDVESIRSAEKWRRANRRKRAGLDP